MITLALFASLLMGTTLGLLGGGGSILAVPILIYLVGMETKAAIAASLLVVGTTSIVAALSHWKAGNVVVRTGLVFGVFAMGGAWIGGSVARFVPGNVLLILFAGLMLVTAVAMLRSRRDEAEAEAEADPVPVAPKKLPILKVGAEGLVVGAVTGLVGAGGGFLVVPALMFLGGLPMRQAIGTSLMVIAMKSFAGFAGYASFVTLDYGLVAAFVVAAVAGTLFGSLLTGFLKAAQLRRGFAWFVLVMGLFILGQKTGLIPGMADDHAPVEPSVAAEQAVESARAAH
jgi:uncharacterized membrane protein YfcA